MTNNDSGTSRRALIAGAASAAALVGAPARAALRSAAGAPKPGGDLQRAGVEAWKAQVGSVFTIRADDGPVALRLVAVKPMAAKGPRPASLPRNAAFAAVFEPTRGTLPAGNRTYAASHPASPPFAIHFGARSETLTAIFN